MDFDARFQALEEKIHHQDKKLRLHKRLGLIAAAMLVGAAAFAATRPVADVIEARKFVLKNQQGRPVGIWGADAGGPSFVLIGPERGNLGLRYGEAGPGILLTDSSGKTRLTLGVIKNEKRGDYPAINFSDPKGRNRITLATQGQKGAVLLFNDHEAGTSSTLGIVGGNPVLVHKDGTGKTRAAFQLVDQSEPILAFKDEKKQTRMMISLPKGTGRFSLMDTEGDTRVSLGLSKSGDASLTFSDKSEVRSIVGMINNTPMIYQMDAAGTLRSSLGLEKDGYPTIIFNDEKGKVIWGEPRNAK